MNGKSIQLSISIVEEVNTNGNEDLKDTIHKAAPSKEILLVFSFCLLLIVGKLVKFAHTLEWVSTKSWVHNRVKQVYDLQIVPLGQKA